MNSGAGHHRGRSPQAVGHDRGRRPRRADTWLGAVRDRPGRLPGDAHLREGMAGSGLGRRGRQRGRATARAATPRGWRARRRRSGQARRPGPALRHRSQPQDRLARIPLPDRGFSKNRCEPFPVAHNSSARSAHRVVTAAVLEVLNDAGGPTLAPVSRRTWVVGTVVGAVALGGVAVACTPGWA